MGKKNKKNSKMENEEEIVKTKPKSKPASESISTVSVSSKNNIINKEHNTKTKIKNKKLDNELVIDKSYHDELEEDDKNKIPNASNDLNQNIKTKNKNKKRKVEDVELRNVESPKVRKVKTYKAHDPNITQENNENKKIVLDDKSQESLIKSKKNKQKFLNDDEAEVRDEDIDKFCDEITEEDNKTYENWVQLFETNFKKSKKPTS